MNDLEDKKVQKSVYTLNGKLVDRVVDELNDNQVVNRTSGKNFIEIKNNKIIRKEKFINLPSIKQHKTPKDLKLNSINPNIGVIDLETYKNIEDKPKVMAAGLFAYGDVNPITIYIDEKDMDSDNVIYKLLDKLFESKYEGYTFYCHNLGDYDSVYIIRSILRYNQANKDNKYVIDFICRKSNKVLKLTIEKKVNNKTKKVKILDSIAILNDDLKSLCEKYNIDKTKVKGNFPHAFSQTRNLFYIGNTPDFSYYEDMSFDDYKLLVKKDWSFKDELLLYLEKDLYSLYEILKKANESFWFSFGIDMTANLTISRLALEIFLKDHYRPNYKTGHVIPLINDKTIYNDIKEAYYGGITEVYKPYGENLNYYDVNSLYPYVSCNFMPGNQIIKKDFIAENTKLDDLFGFFFCDIESTNNYLGLLPVRDKGLLIFPNGKWSGWYFSEELKYAANKGYRIKVIKGYQFNKVENMFNSYIDKLIDLKINGLLTTTKETAKLLLNSFLGRFGLDINRYITDLVEKEQRQLIACSRSFSSEIDIDDEFTLLTYNPEIDPEICRQYKVDVSKVLNSNIKIKGYNSGQAFQHVSVAIAAAVTAYGRIHITKIKKGILELGGNIYYSDTDSIATNLDLPKNMLDENEIGKLKLVHYAEKAYFITNKLYCLLVNGKTYIKSKGLISRDLKWDDFVKLYHKHILDVYRTNTEKDYAEGIVYITKKKVKLDPNSYTKRVKIYDKNGLWVDTKPLIIPYEKEEDSKPNSLNSSQKNLKLNSNNTSLTDSSGQYKTVIDKFDSLNLKEFIFFTLPISLLIAISSCFYYISHYLIESEDFIENNTLDIELDNKFNNTLNNEKDDLFNQNILKTNINTKYVEDDSYNDNTSTYENEETQDYNTELSEIEITNKINFELNSRIEKVLVIDSSINIDEIK